MRFFMCGNFQVRNLELVVLGLAVKRARRNPTCQPLLGVPEEFACMGYTAILFSASLVTFVVDIQYYVLCLCVCQFVQFTNIRYEKYMFVSSPINVWGYSYI